MESAGARWARERDEKELREVGMAGRITRRAAAVCCERQIGYQEGD